LDPDLWQPIAIVHHLKKGKKKWYHSIFSDPKIEDPIFGDLGYPVRMPFGGFP